MATNELTSARVASIAGKYLANPDLLRSLDPIAQEEILSVMASVLTQVPDKKQEPRNLLAEVLAEAPGAHRHYNALLDYAPTRR